MTEPLSNDESHLPSPEQLLRKILVKFKVGSPLSHKSSHTSKHNLAEKIEEKVEEELHLSKKASIPAEANAREVTPEDEDASDPEDEEDNGGDKHKNKIAQSMSELAVYCKASKFKSLKNSLGNVSIALK